MATKPTIVWTPAHPNNYTVGRNRPIRYITFHHVVGSDDSAISAFQQPTRAGSAHFVVGDTKITQMVALENTAWTNANWSSNNECITIEHEGDWRFGYHNQAVLDNSAKLVAWLRTLYPSIGFNRHREVSTNGTVCPADLPVEWVWNKATEIMNPPKPPTPPAPPVTPVNVTDIANRLVITNKDANLWDLTFNTWGEAKSIKVIPKATPVEISAIAKHKLGGTYYMTEYSFSKGIMNGINVVDCSEIPVTEPPKPPVVEPPIVTPPVEPPVTPPVVPPIDDETNNFLKSLVVSLGNIIKSITDFLLRRGK